MRGTGWVSVVVLLAVAGLAGCGQGGSGGAGATGSGSPTPGSDALVGHTYVATSVQNGSTKYPLVPGAPVRLTFTADGISASAGCNTMSGTGTVTGGMLVLNGSLSQTEMACDPPIMKQEQWWATVLTSKPQVTVNGDVVTLTNDSSVVAMVDESTRVPDRPVTGTQWRLDGIIDGDVASSVPNGASALVRFADGSVDVSGCNDYRAAYTASGNTLTIAPLHTVGAVRPCPSTGDEIDRTLQRVLTGTVTYAIDGDQMTLTNGSSALTFQAMLRM